MSLFGGPAQAPAVAAPDQSAKPEAKKRKRAPHDKNAPKRPRTPYFLYMQFARDGIAREMGSDYSNKQVQDEGTRRWNSMGKDEKEASPLRVFGVRVMTTDRSFQQWAELYGCNYAGYKRKVQAYKAGLPIPEFTAEEARQLYDEDRNIGAASAPAHDATSDHDENVDSEEESDDTSSSSDEDSPEPPKAVSPPKSPRASKRGKSAKGKVEKKASPVKEPAPVEPSPKSPETERKKKGTRKNDAKATVGTTEPKHEDQVDSGSSPTKAKKDSEPEPKSKRKKRKSEALGA